MGVEQSIFSYLEKGARLKSDLLRDVTARESVSVQAVYKILRKLRAEGKLVEHKDSLSLSMWHIENEYKRWAKVSAVYESRLSYSDFIFLEPGKKFTRYFNTYNDLDRYWVTAFLLIERILPQGLHSYTLMPHDWYIYAHVESDVYWSKNHKQKQRLIITNPFEADKLVSRIRRKSGYEVTYGVNPLKQNDRKHFSIVGNWIFEVDFDEKFTESLVEFIKPLRSIENVDLTQIRKMINEKGRFKMSVYHNEKKASEMVRKLKKYFE